DVVVWRLLVAKLFDDEAGLWRPSYRFRHRFCSFPLPLRDISRRIEQWVWLSNLIGDFSQSLVPAPFIPVCFFHFEVEPFVPLVDNAREGLADYHAKEAGPLVRCCQSVGDGVEPYARPQSHG